MISKPKGRNQKAPQTKNQQKQRSPSLKVQKQTNWILTIPYIKKNLKVLSMESMSIQQVNIKHIRIDMIMEMTVKLSARVVSDKSLQQQKILTIIQTLKFA